MFDKTLSSALAYNSRLYSETLVMQPSVYYILYAASSHKQTGDIITFARFEEGDNLVGNGPNVA